jgi:hypothetical protein
MAKLTRLATTVTARYYPAPDLADAFYLDGRLSGKREARSADITIDKEDKGFLLSVFSHGMMTGHDPAAEPVYLPHLQKINNEAKSGRKPLMELTGDCVNMAVSVTGRMKIQSENVRGPFFAGAVVKDSEVFAITMGKGLAFLYRDDTLFPLTNTDIRIDPINTQRQKVENFDYYCAGKIATAHCSHVLKLEMDDCLILCNREVYEALGQHELLRILYDAEDQCDAAGVVMTEASAKLPGVPMQFMISFVESVSAPEKGGLFGFGRKKSTRAYDDAEEDAIEIPIARATATPTSAETTTVAPPPVEPVEENKEVEPLFFGQQATNPFVQPLAEAPVVPAGPEDSLQINDVPMRPYGEPIDETEAKIDEGGFVKPEFDEDESVDDSNSVFDEAEASVEDAANDEELNVSPVTNQETPRFIPDDPEDDDGVELFFGDDVSAQKDETSEPVSFDDSVHQPERPVYSGATQQQPQGSSYFIPFATAQEDQHIKPETTSIDDVPDMPLYDAATYTPPAYPADSKSPQSFDSTGVYARGSYSIEDENDSDIRRDFPVRPAGRSYSYTPPPQTVPSYGESREAMKQSRPAPGTRPGSAMQQRRQPESRRYSQDVFDQDDSSDYGEPDAAYKRNRLLMIGLVGLIIIFFIILIAVAINNNNKQTATSQTTSATSDSVSTSSESTQGPTEQTTPTTSGTSEVTTAPVSGEPNYMTNPPMAQFHFTDATGFRTWWDLMYRGYNVNITTESDPRIAFIIKYNGLPEDYAPKDGDVVYMPDLKLLPTVAPEQKETT